MYSDINIVNQFEMLKKSCIARGMVIALEMVYSYDAANKPTSCAENIIIRRNGVIVFIAVSFVHAQGFLDGLDFAEHDKK